MGKSIPKSEKHRVGEEPGARRVRKLPESLGWSRTELGSGRRRSGSEPAPQPPRGLPRSSQVGSTPPSPSQ